MYISSSAEVLKSAADMTARSISVFDRPVELHGDAERLVHPRLGLAVTQGRVDQGNDLVELLLAHQLANGLAHRGRVGLLAAEVAVPELVGLCEASIAIAAIDLARDSLAARLTLRIGERGWAFSLGRCRRLRGRLLGFVRDAELTATTAAKTTTATTAIRPPPPPNRRRPRHPC